MILLCKLGQFEVSYVGGYLAVSSSLFNSFVGVDQSSIKVLVRSRIGLKDYYRTVL